MDVSQVFLYRFQLLILPLNHRTPSHSIFSIRVLFQPFYLQPPTNNHLVFGCSCFFSCYCSCNSLNYSTLPVIPFCNMLCVCSSSKGSTLHLDSFLVLWFTGLPCVYPYQTMLYLRCIDCKHAGDGGVRTCAINRDVIKNRGHMLVVLPSASYAPVALLPSIYCIVLVLFHWRYLLRTIRPRSPYDYFPRFLS